MPRSTLFRSFLICALLIATSAIAQEPQGLDALKWLAGEWRGVGQGEPGTSASERHASLVLESRFLRVEGRSVYPRQERNPKGEIHAELDMWSYDRARKSIVLRQFDTLGFVVTYVLDPAASAPDRWVLVAEHLENVPKGTKARYTYTRVSDDEYHEMLELDWDGKGSKPYVTNRFLRLKAPAAAQ